MIDCVSAGAEVVGQVPAAGVSVRYPRGGDAVPCLRQPRPEHTINRGEATPWVAGTMCKGPVAKPNDLQLQCRVRTNEEPKRVEHRNDVGHDEPSLFGTASSLSRHKTYPVFVGTSIEDAGPLRVARTVARILRVRRPATRIQNDLSDR